MATKSHEPTEAEKKLALRILEEARKLEDKAGRKLDFIPLMSEAVRNVDYREYGGIELPSKPFRIYSELPPGVRSFISEIAGKSPDQGEKNEQKVREWEADWQRELQNPKSSVRATLHPEDDALYLKELEQQELEEKLRNRGGPKMR